MPKSNKRLLIDAGNSQAKLVYATGRQLLIETFQRTTTDKLEDLSDTISTVDEILLASVSAYDWASHLHGLPIPKRITIHHLQSPAQHSLLKNAYSEPSQLGIDRWLAMLGARVSSDEALCVADLGTATTLSLIHI